MSKKHRAIHDEHQKAWLKYMEDSGVSNPVIVRVTMFHLAPSVTHMRLAFVPASPIPRLMASRVSGLPPRSLSPPTRPDPITLLCGIIRPLLWHAIVTARCTEVTRYHPPHECALTRSRSFS